MNRPKRFLRTRLALVTLVSAFAMPAGVAFAAGVLPPAVAQALAGQNVVWDTPSADAKGSMPIGNGDIGLNVWVEPSGDLVFLIGKTDAWDENMRLLKLGKVRVKFTPSLIQAGKPFTQTLDLAHGVCVVRTADAEVQVWVDANHPVIQVDAKSLNGGPLTATASFEIWRKVKRALPIAEQGYPAGQQPAYSWPDTVLPAGKNQIGWYHRNAASSWRYNLELQKLGEAEKQQGDPIMNRTMGAIMRGEGWEECFCHRTQNQPARRRAVATHPSADTNHRNRRRMGFSC